MLHWFPTVLRIRSNSSLQSAGQQGHVTWWLTCLRPNVLASMAAALPKTHKALPTSGAFHGISSARTLACSSSQEWFLLLRSQLHYHSRQDMFPDHFLFGGLMATVN